MQSNVSYRMTQKDRHTRRQKWHQKMMAGHVQRCYEIARLQFKCGFLSCHFAWHCCGLLVSSFNNLRL